MRTPGAYLCTMASVIDERQAEIAEEFAMFGDWMEKYEHIISWARSWPP